MTEPRVTDEDVDQASRAAEGLVSRSVGDYYRLVLETAFRPGGVVDRAVAAELDQLAQDAANSGMAPGPGFLLWLANERREGRRDDD